MAHAWGDRRQEPACRDTAPQAARALPAAGRTAHARGGVRRGGGAARGLPRGGVEGAWPRGGGVVGWEGAGLGGCHGDGVRSAAARAAAVAACNGPGAS